MFLFVTQFFPSVGDQNNKLFHILDTTGCPEVW